MSHRGTVACAATAGWRRPSSTSAEARKGSGFPRAGPQLIAGLQVGFGEPLLLLRGPLLRCLLPGGRLLRAGLALQVGAVGALVGLDVLEAPLAVPHGVELLAGPAAVRRSPGHARPPTECGRGDSNPHALSGTRS